MGESVPSRYIRTCMETYDLLTFITKILGGYLIIVKKNCFKLHFEFDFLTALCFSNY